MHEKIIPPFHIDSQSILGRHCNERGKQFKQKPVNREEIMSFIDLEICPIRRSGSCGSDFGAIFRWRS